jgi:glycosyltransferase involved in cell wall biosynthesis
VNILAHVHAAPPVHGAGAEWYLMSVMRYLAGRGHTCTIIARDCEQGYEFKDVTVLPAVDAYLQWRRADLGVTHLDMTSAACAHARQSRTPLVHLVHNHNQLRYHKVRPQPWMLAVFNSEWVRRAVRWQGASIVLRPPVFGGDYRCKRGTRITLMNMNEDKGVNTFYGCASRLPEHGFLGVKGMYGKQFMLPRQNVKLVPNQQDARVVYRDTRILLMPSAYESWGRVAIEAAHSGIPTIAHPTPGLRESLGDAGLFVDRTDTDGWVRELQRLDDPKEYLRASRASRARARQLDPGAELASFAELVEAFVGSRPRKR